MTGLVFLFAIAVIFGAVLALEASDSDSAEPRRPLGLASWITSGNWPAKVGGGLLVVGVGSLLRYALINFDVSPSLKLGVGVAAAGLLGLASTLTRSASSHRAVSLALGGAAFGVAYLTAYSAFALFHYLDSVVGTGLLAITAVGAGVYAISRSALSLGLLAMAGAFLAPAFAIDDPGPLVVYGYYTAASLLTLAMVAFRGWRPLIHLSFLFTLAGGAFFAWTSHYYSADYAGVMLPALLVLAAIHVAMPLVEDRSVRGAWTETLDIAYLLFLPLVVALSALILAPSRLTLSYEMMALAAIWLTAAGYLKLARRDGHAVHAVIGAMFLGLSVAARFQELPWELILLALSVGALWIAAHRSTSTQLHNVLAGLVPLVGFMHVISSLSPVAGSSVFVNGRFIERSIGAGLLIFAGQICRGIRQSLDTFLLTIGIGWAVLAIGSELVRWDFMSFTLLVHWAFIATAIVLAIIPASTAAVGNAIVIVALCVVATASVVKLDVPQSAAWISLAVAPLALIWLSIRRAALDAETRAGRLVCAVTAPLVAGIWALHAGVLVNIHSMQFVLSAAATALVLVILLGFLAPRRSADWIAAVAEMAAVAFAVTLLLASTVWIGRSPWAALLEMLCLFGLAYMVIRNHPDAPLPRWVGIACAIGVALVIQTNLLRWLGPAGDLNMFDISRMRLPTLISLLWAAVGASLTVWGRNRASRSFWVAGATLLVAAAVKMVLVDFGSLGQLTNILAVIAAGIVFLLVGWLAPIPPAANIAPATPQTSIARPAPPVATNAQDAAKPSLVTANDSNRKRVWTIAIVALLALAVTQCGHETRALIFKILGHEPSDSSELRQGPVSGPAGE
jgi:hypothetical protein